MIAVDKEEVVNAEIGMRKSHSLIFLSNFSSLLSWSPISQQIMGGLQNITYIDVDVMHPVSQIPVHLAHINNTCPTPDTSCVLQMNTVTENIYPSTIAADNPFFPLAAIEVYHYNFAITCFRFVSASMSHFLSQLR